jgi:uncharacterized membrane protein
MKKLGAYFLQGLLYTAPLGATVYILYKAFVAVDNLTTSFFHTYIPGLGIVMLVLIITLLGFFADSLLARPVLAMLNRALLKIPVMKDVYSPIRDFFSAFMGKERKFNQPVLVKVNNITNLEKVGFLTQEDLSILGIADKKVAVYFPHSYAFSGELFIVPADAVTPLNQPSSEVMKFIVSGGAVKGTSENRDGK